MKSLKQILCELQEGQWEEFLFYLDHIYPRWHHPSKYLTRYEQVSYLLEQLSERKQEIVILVTKVAKHYENRIDINSNEMERS